MAYGILNSPLPSLTVTPTGERCCGMRGLGYQPGAHALLGFMGDDPAIFDTTSTDPGSGLIDPGITDQPSPIIDLTPVDLPLPNQLSPSISDPLIYPTSVGTEFTSNGDGSYTNIQTGQTVPYSIAEQITTATAGAPAVDTTATGQNLNITDASGATSTINTNNLSIAAQALQAAGQLVNAAGKLTAQGQALLNQGNLYKAPPATGVSAGLTGAMSSLTSWMHGSTVIAGVPNIVIALGVPMLLIIASQISFGGGKKRRK